MLITLYTTRALLVALGVDDYGLYNVVCGFVSMFSFLNTSMANGIQRFYNFEIGSNKHENGIARIYTHSFIIQIVLAAIIIIAIETFGIWYLNNKMVIPDGRFYAASWIFQFSMISLFFVVVSVPYSAAVMAYEKMDFYAILSILDAILKLVIVIILPYLHDDQLIWYGGLVALISFINCISYFIYCKFKFADIKIIKGLDKKILSSILSFSGWNVFGSFAHMFRNQGVNLVFNYFWGTFINAANGIAGQVNAAVESLTQSFLTAVRPQMIKSYASGDIYHLMKMTISVSKLTFFLIMLLAVPLMGEISTILDAWLGCGKYPKITAVFCQLTMIMTLFNSFATPISTVVHATGKMRKFQVICSFVILAVVPFAYVSSRLGGSPELVLVISILVVIATQIVRLFLVRELVDFSVMDYIKKVCYPTLRVFFIVLLFTFGIHWLLPNGIIYSLIVMATSVVTSCIIIYYWGLDDTERELAVSFIHSKNKKNK